MAYSARPPLDLQPPGPGVIQRWVRGTALMIVVLVSIVFVNQAWINNQVNEQIRLRIEEYVTRALPQITVKVGSVERIGNHGVRLENVEVSLPAVTLNDGESSVWDASPVLEIRQLDLIGSTDYATLLQQQPVVQQIELYQGRVNIKRNRKGQWNVVELIQRLQSSVTGESPGSVPTIRLSQLELAIVGADQVSAEPLLIMLEDTVIAEAEREHVLVSDERQAGQQNHGRVLEIRSKARNQFVHSIEIKGAVSLDQQQSILAMRINGLQLTNDLLEHLPLQVVDRFPAGMEVRGELDLAVQLQTQVATDDPDEIGIQSSLQTEWIAAGVVANGLYRDRRLPYPVTDISSTMTWQNGVLRLEKIHGRFGSTPVLAHARIVQVSSQPVIDVDVTADKMLIDEALTMGLKDDGSLAGVRQALHTYAPRGTAAISFHYDNVGERPRSDLNIRLLDMDITYEKFPYTLKNASGMIRIENGHLYVHQLKAHSHGRVFEINADIKDSKDHPQGWLEITSDGAVPLDAELIKALDPQTRKTVDDLRLTGMISLQRARYEYNGQKTNPYRELELDLSQGTVFYRDFPYPIHRIHGNVVLTGKRWEFREFSGYKGSAFIQMRGGLNKQNPQGAPLQLVFTATDIALDHDLRDALSAKNGSTLQSWKSLNPAGSLDQVRITLESTLTPGGTHVLVHGKKWVPTDSLTTSTIRFMPEWLPYRIEGITGEFIMQDGHVRLTGIHGKHGATEFSLDGVYNRAPSGQWHLALDHLSVDRLRLNADLLAALPPALGRTLRRLDVQGQFQLDGDLYLSHDPQSVKPLHASWNMQLDTAGASIHSSSRITDIYGGVQFTGVFDDRGFRTSAAVDIDSLFWKHQQITKISGPLWIDSEQLLAGTWARAGRQQQSSQNQNVIRQPQRPVDSLTINGFGGVAKLDLQVRFAENQTEAVIQPRSRGQLIQQALPRFMLQATLSQADLTQIARYHGNQERTSGRLDAGLRLRGMVGDRASWIGDGRIRLNHADTYQLPLMVVLFNKLDQKDDRGVFSSTEIDFRVKSQQVILDRIDLRGDTVSLYGTGWMSFDEEINLNFYSRVGRQQLAIPFLNTVLSAASKSLLQIEVVGSVNQPRVNGTAFPELDGTMERILKNLEPRIASPLRGGDRGGILQLR